MFAESRTCFLPMITELSAHLIKLHKHYQKGYLYRAGGVSEQPNLYLSAMEILG